MSLLGTPRASEWKGTGPVGSKSHTYRLDRDYLDAQALELQEHQQKLLPTPAVNDMGANKTPDEWATWTAQMEARHHNSNGHGNSLAIETQTIPTLPRRDGWGPYAAAIARWEQVLNRPAPYPTKPGPAGPRLSAPFTEWLMGLPAGWVTEIPGVGHRAQLKMLGNGVVPQQAAAALRHLGINGIPFSRT